jgi:hypothetical protein
MKKTIIIGLGILLVLAFVAVAGIGGLYLHFLNQYNPTYHGKRVYAWADQAVYDQDPAARREATQVLLEAWPDMQPEPRVHLAMHVCDLSMKSEGKNPLPKEVLPFLIEATKCPDMPPHSYPEMALQFGKGPDTVPALKEAVKNERDPDARKRIQLVLDQLSQRE